METPSEILQEKHNYPFGMSMEGPWMQSGANNPYQYNGKKLVEDLGLDLMDYGARWYDAAAARWWSTDNLMEQTPRDNPYHYTHNNPINNVDLFGLSSYRYNWASGQYYDANFNYSSWSNVSSSVKNSFSSQSFYIVSKDRTEKDGSTDWALQGVFTLAKGSFMNILEVSDSKDAYKKLKKYTNGGKTIGNIIFDSHGTYPTASFKIGNQRINLSNYASGSVYLRSIGELLSNDSEVCLLACHAGSPSNGGIDLLSAIAKRMNTTVYGSQSWTGVNPFMFLNLSTPSSGPRFIENSGERPNALKYLGKWTKATCDGNTSTLEGSLYIGPFGGFSTGSNPFQTPSMENISIPGHAPSNY